MKFKFAITFILCTSVVIVKPYKFTKIDNVEGNIQFIEFDRQNSDNIYVIGNHESGATFYKLNSKKDIITKDEIQLKNIQKIFITNSNNAYIYDANSIVSNGGSLYFLKHDSLELEKIFEFPLDKDQPHVYFMTSETIYFNTANGVATLKTREHEEHGLTTPKSIENLEHFSITNYNTVGINNGNICLGGTFKGDPNPKIAIIIKHEQGKELPSADVKNITNPDLNLITSIAAEADKRNALIAFSGPIARIFKVSEYESYVFEKGQERTMTETNLDPIFGEYLQYFASFYSTKNRFYFFASNLFTADCYLNYADVHYEKNRTRYKFSSISNMNFIGADNDCEHVNFASDSNEKIFFTLGKKKVYSLKYKDTEIKEILFPADKPDFDVSAILVDDNDRLWVLAGDLFMVPKDKMKAQQITKSSFATQPKIMKIHPKTKEIFIGSENGLHVYSN